MGLLSGLGKRGASILDRPWAQPLNAASPVGEALSMRQRQMLEMAAAGMNEEQIARALSGRHAHEKMPVEAVRIFMRRANGKVGAANDYQGWSDGLLPPGLF